MTSWVSEDPAAHTRRVSFLFVSDHLALDFAATVAWRATDPKELLAGPGDFARWAVAAGVVDRLDTVTQDDLTRARALREAVYRLALAATADEPADPRDVTLVRRAAAHPPVRPALHDLGRVERRGGVTEVLATLATTASDLFGGPDRLLVRRCAGTPCTRLFVDRSRAGTRRWCDKRSCGSRVNAAAYRRRGGRPEQV
ncbi:CGNR zinc finger domain-containing protein [Streptomyces galbus]|uniref:CGNR zinc finger domain-containing protein n=1 Tax=Streptomyces galbus TaxID=33898 RepID=UPI001E3E6B15|nr:ABATE domain-containing protein [Streptomyces galbus]